MREKSPRSLLNVAMFHACTWPKMNDYFCAKFPRSSFPFLHRIIAQYLPHLQGQQSVHGCSGRGPGRLASVDFSETCRSIPTDPQRLCSSQHEHGLLKLWQPWLAAFGTNPAAKPRTLEVPHARTCHSTGTSWPRLGSNRHAPSLWSVWQPRLAPNWRNSWLKMCEISTFCRDN